jgi:hypothetical protein
MHAKGIDKTYHTPVLLYDTFGSLMQSLTSFNLYSSRPSAHFALKCGFAFIRLSERFRGEEDT